MIIYPATINTIMAKTFLKMLESAMQRYTRSGVLVGDYIKLVDGYKSHEPFKELTPSVQDAVENLIKTGLNLRVVNVKNKYPSAQPGNIDSTNGEVVLDIAADEGGGRYTTRVTIPVCCVEVQDYTPGYAPFPDSVKRPNNTILKPEPLKIEPGESYDRTRKTTQGESDKDSDLELPVKNTKITTVKVKPVSYTKNYLPK